MGSHKLLGGSAYSFSILVTNLRGRCLTLWAGLHVADEPTVSLRVSHLVRDAVNAPPARRGVTQVLASLGTGAALALKLGANPFGGNVVAHRDGKPVVHISAVMARKTIVDIERCSRARGVAYQDDIQGRAAADGRPDPPVVGHVVVDLVDEDSVTER